MMFDTLQALGSLDEVIVATTSSRLPMTRSSPTGQKKKVLFHTVGEPKFIVT
jgi:hypothetical protein